MGSVTGGAGWFLVLPVLMCRRVCGVRLYLTKFFSLCRVVFSITNFDFSKVMWCAIISDQFVFFMLLIYVHLVVIIIQ